MVEPGLDRHEWETEWQALEPLVADSPAEALPELDELIARMMVARGYPVSTDEGGEPPEPEIVAEFLERDVSRSSSTAARPSTRATSARRSRPTAISTSTCSRPIGLTSPPRTPLVL